MKMFNLYWGGNKLSHGSPHREDCVIPHNFFDALSDESIASISKLEVGQSFIDEDEDRWERVE